MSDTPETDNFIVSAGYVRTDHQWRTFARKLERGRNSLQDQRDFAMGEIERLRKERDEAREALRSFVQKMQDQAAVFKREDLRDNSRWSIFNEGRAQALEKFAEDLEIAK